MITRESGTRLRLDRPIVLSLFFAEAAAIVAALSLHRLGDRRFLDSLGTRPGLVVAACVVVIAASFLVVVRRIRRRGELRLMGFTIAVNLLTVVLIAAATECTIRALSVEGFDTPVVGETPLLPRRWEKTVTQNRRLLAGVVRAILIEDEILGWRPAAGRSSQNGLYHISDDGVRARSPGGVLRDVKTTHRVALVGDSFTFCDDVRFEDSWGHRLEQRLGSGYQVVNFGVSGYGVDQAYLRYVSEAREWNPQIVILCVFPHDFHRTLVVYPFIDFPSWALPFSKPRFVITGDRLTRIPPTPALRLFDRDSVLDLPHVDLTPGFNPEDWQWSWIHRSYLVRYAISRFPAQRRTRAEVSAPKMREINARILGLFKKECLDAGSTPFVVYLPSRLDLNGRNYVKEAVLEPGLIDRDLTTVVGEVAQSQRFVPGKRHYSPTTNTRIATALEASIRSITELRR